MEDTWVFLISFSARFYMCLIFHNMWLISKWAEISGYKQETVLLFSVDSFNSGSLYLNSQADLTALELLLTSQLSPLRVNTTHLWAFKSPRKDQPHIRCKILLSQAALWPGALQQEGPFSHAASFAPHFLLFRMMGDQRARWQKIVSRHWACCVVFWSTASVVAGIRVVSGILQPHLHLQDF